MDLTCDTRHFIIQLCNKSVLTASQQIISSVFASSTNVHNLVKKAGTFWVLIPISETECMIVNYYSMSFSFSGQLHMRAKENSNTCR